LFLFGGSTMWGTGSRDAHTIPAILARELALAGKPVEVTNFGEAGYVSTQELIAWMLELRAGNVPDIVVFYDGVNDVFTAFQEPVAGVTHNERNRVKEFNLTHPDQQDRLRRTAWAAWVGDLATVRFAAKLSGNKELSFDRLAGRAPSLRLASSPPEALPGEVAKVYRGNMEMAATLAARHGVQCLFYLQPTIYQKPVRTGSELKRFQHGMRRRAGLDGLVEASYAAIRSELAQSPVAGQFRDVSGVFAQESAPIFIDMCHVVEPGNARIAGAMLPDLVAAWETVVAQRARTER